MDRCTTLACLNNALLLPGQHPEDTKCRAPERSSRPWLSNLARATLYLANLRASAWPQIPSTTRYWQNVSSAPLSRAEDLCAAAGVLVIFALMVYAVFK